MYRRKGNNKGLSLVELIVAVAILAIIVLPLLRSFMVSTETNMKAKKQQQAVELAQNIMEEMEVSDLQTLAKEFDYPGTSKLLGAADMQELTDVDANGEYELAKKTQPGLTSSIFKDGSNYTFVGQSSKKYYFALKNIKADGRKYDALIKLDGVTDSSVNDANTKDLATIYKMDQNHDAMSLAKQTPQTVLNTLSGMYPGLAQRDITRTITVDITKNAATSVTQVKVSYSYHFVAPDGTTVDYTGSPADPASYTDTVFDNAGDTGRSLNNIYLFYYPWYTSTVGNKTDKIIINNNDTVDATLILIKQEEGQTGLQNLEDNYSVDVTLYEALGAGSTNTKLSIRTNLDENLVTGNATIGKQGNYILVSNGTSYTNASARMGVRKLTDQAPSDRLFDVTVEIYKSGSYDVNFKNSSAIVSITGGMVN